MARLAANAMTWARAVRAWMAAGFHAVRRDALADRARWGLGAPVGFGAGIAVYFAFPLEPPSWSWIAAIGAAIFMVAAAQWRRAGLVPLLASALVFAGFSAAQYRAQSVAAPILPKEYGGAWVVAEVLAVEPRAPGHRLLLGAPRVEGLSPEKTPARVRVTVAAGAPGVRPGDRVRLRAVLRPPPEPAAPGAFDFARQAYFQRIGAVGFALGEVATLRQGAAMGWESWWADRRSAVAGHVRGVVGGNAGAVAAALMTGERGAIPDSVLVAMRDAGLAHLLAISGLHVGLVAGLVFFAVRGALALVPYVTLRWPIKTWAALAAGLAAGGYLLLVGATIPTQRAFVMVALMLFATAINRSAITMRLVAWAAVAVLVLSPESVINVSFQMSFAATTALVATYETLKARGWTFSADRSVASRIGGYAAGVAITSVVATIATAPFAVYHFNRVALFGLAANLVAVPLTAMVVMPLALLAFALMPLGLDPPALVAMGWGIDAVLAVAHTVAGWPGAVLRSPTPPLWGFLAITLGGIWICLWTRRWRWLGLGPILVGLAAIPSGPAPDVLVAGDARIVAVRGEEGGLWLSTSRRARYTGEVWTRRAGQREPAIFPDAGGHAPVVGLRCDPLGCIQERGEWTVAIVHDGRALHEDCGIADVVVATLPVARQDCSEPAILIDRFDLWREGAHAVTFAKGRARVETVRAHRGRRPWVVPRGWD